MANKVLIVVLGAVVLASLVVGGLLGMQFAGGDDDPLTTTPTGADVESTTPAPTATPTVTATPAATSEPTATPTPEPTATPVPEERFSPDSVNTTAVELELRALLDEEVRSNRQPLANEAVLDEMAQFHAENMAKQGYADYTAGGYNTKQRYEEFDRYSHCRVPTDNNAGIRDGEELEVNERVSINVSADWNETQIAQQLLAEWTVDETAMERLTYKNAEQAGVGVAVSDDARVYVTVDLC